MAFVTHSVRAAAGISTRPRTFTLGSSPVSISRLTVRADTHPSWVAAASME